MDKQIRLYLDSLKDHSLPAAFVDLRAFDNNIASLVAELRKSDSPKTLRLATKSLRVPALIRRALEKGQPFFKGLMTYRAFETCFLAEQGFDDFLLAYPVVEAQALEALVKIHSKGKRVRIVVDSREGLEALDKAVKRSASPRAFSVLVDVDASLRIGNKHIGVRRSPLRDKARVKCFVELIRGEFPQLSFEGFMMYEAQVAGLGDRYPHSPIKNWLYSQVRRRSLRHVLSLRQELKEAFPDILIFNGGGSGSFSSIVNEKAITELTVGSALYAPHLFEYYSDTSYEPACFFALRAVRAPMEGWVTLQGGGYVASGAADAWRLPKVFYPTTAELSPDEGCGEVQTPLFSPELRVGDVALLRHAKAGELAERFNDFWLLENDGALSSTPTYRGLGKCFL